jgi:hypothetical protein
MDRLASMTGGRMTASSNDFTVGYARARHDLGCRYTIGFYDRKPEEDKSHTLRVESAVPGVVVHHASSYSFPSRATRRAAAMEAAYMVPSMFQGGGMRAQVFPLESRDGKSWDSLVAIDFPVPASFEEHASLEREFGAVLTSGPEIASRFGRRVSLKGTAKSAPGAERRLTFLEPATLSTGRYTLKAVLSDPGSETPYSAQVDLTVPEIPSRRPFLIGPMIGRRSGSDVVIHGGEDRQGAPADRVGGAASFRPLIVTETDREQPLFALTEACVSKREAKHGPWRVSRHLEAASGVAAGSVSDALFPSDVRAKMTCERYVDAVPVSRLRLGGYTFQSLLLHRGDGKAAIEDRAAPFFLREAAAAGPK